MCDCKKTYTLGGPNCVVCNPPRDLIRDAFNEFIKKVMDKQEKK